MTMQLIFRDIAMLACIVMVMWAVVYIFKTPGDNICKSASVWCFVVTALGISDATDTARSASKPLARTGLSRVLKTEFQYSRASQQMNSIGTLNNGLWKRSMNTEQYATFFRRQKHVCSRYTATGVAGHVSTRKSRVSCQRGTAMCMPGMWDARI